MELFIGIGLLSAALFIFAIACLLSEEKSSKLTLFFLKSEMTALLVTVLASFGVALASKGASETGLFYETAGIVIALIAATIVSLRVPRNRRRMAKTPA